ncbi:Protein of unknown function DUF761, plant [Dillenia turbinata]|uniref:Uncharacterized protein n=1 Tax=Dillenia turbinata TaxID=194707 RepID=A0AAN8YWG2_9MAGN
MKKNTNNNNMPQPQTHKNTSTSEEVWDQKKRALNSRVAGKNEEDMVVKQLEKKTTEDINASAEAFIKKFRQQLLIQRLESIENYEQMLGRGL